MPALVTVTDSGTIFPNNGKETRVSPGLAGFTCGQALSPAAGATMTLGANGLYGGLLEPLLNQLGGIGKLLADVPNANAIIDGRLATYSSVNLVADLLSLVTSLDIGTSLPAGQQVPAGYYAAYAFSLPPVLVNVSAGLKLNVKTYLGGVATGDATSLDVARLSVLWLGPTEYGFVGFKATKPYDRVVLSVQSSLLSASLGEVVRVHELCVAPR